MACRAGFSPRRRTDRHSSFLPLAGGAVSSTTPAPAASIGRVHSTRTTRAARGTSTSIRTVAAWTTTIATTVGRSGQCVPRVRTNPCLFPRATGKGAEIGGRCACGASYPAPSGYFCGMTKTDDGLCLENTMVNRVVFEAVLGLCFACGDGTR